jgi:hypothetical protein
MAITQALANAFKKQLLEGDHNFASSGGDKFKIALYTSSATLNSTTTAYSASNEVGDSGQYTAGGGALVNGGTSIGSGTGKGVAMVDFADRSFTGVTLTARGALIYNTSSATTNAAVAVLDFGADKTATSGTFTIQFPAFTTAAAILRISG